MDKINVLIADDHTLFRKGVRRILERESLVTCHPGINMIKSSWR